MKSLVAALLAGLALLAGPAAAADPQKGDAPPTDAALIEAAGFAPGDVGYLVIDLGDKKVLAEHNPDQPFIPASVAKIAAIAAALEILGGEHRFATTLDAEGEVANGVLTGSLTLRGGGDPFLTGDDLQAMAKQLAASGIKSVDGSFHYDASARIDIPQIDATQPEAADYNTGVSALSVNFNRVRLDWQKKGDDLSATAATVSENLVLQLDAIGLAFGGDDMPGPFVRTGAPAEDRWLLSPDLPAKGEDWLPVANPSRIAAEAFRALATAAGVDLPPPSPGVMPDKARELARHDSIPLTDIAGQVLHSSNNLSAELIGLAASLSLTGHELSLADSASALTRWWQAHLPDSDWTGFHLENHSGLSSKSHVTPRQIVLMLEDAAGLPGGADFPDLLRQIGWKDVKGSARVKTGTMSYARGLAGYIDTAAGHRLVFAIFFNDAAKRAALDAAFDPHVRDIDRPSRRWRDRAIGLETKLTTGWAGQF